MAAPTASSPLLFRVAADVCQKNSPTEKKKTTQSLKYYFLALIGDDLTTLILCG